MTDNSTQKIADLGTALLPPFAYNAAKRLYYRWQFARAPHTRLLHANARLKGRGNGKKAFLIGTGPSLKTMDLKKLEGQDCFSVSNFYLHEHIDIVKPKLHFFAPYHLPLDRNNFVDWLRDADARLPAETNMVLGLSDYEMVRGHKIFENREKYYLYLSPVASSSAVDLEKPVLRPQTSPLMILPVLIYMGYSEIYLLGCDHNVLRYYREDIEHFYDVKKDVRIGASDKSTWSDIITQHESSVKVFRQYAWYLDKFSARYGFRLVNLSASSWLDFVDFDTLDNVIHD